MTNIATFGLEFDPTGAINGAHRLIIELRILGEQVDRTAGKADKSAGAWSKMAKVLVAVAAAALAAVAALKAFSVATDLIKESIDAASKMEGFRNQWAFFLGSFDAAKKKMAELQNYANSTPFDLPGVTQAALSLAKLKDTGLETMEGLKMIGDAAGVASQPIEEVALRIAKMVNNLKRGGGAGDEASVLGEWMIFSPELIGKLKDLGDEAKNFPVLLEAIKKELALASGGTQLMSTSWEGMVSTMEDSWNSFKTALGEPLITALKPLLADITAIIDNMTKQMVAMGPAIQNFASYIPATFRALSSDGGFKLALTAAWDSFVQLMDRTWKGLEPTLTSIFKRAGWEMINAFNKLADPSFWDGMVKAVSGAISRAINEAMPWVDELMEVLRGSNSTEKAVLGAPRVDTSSADYKRQYAESEAAAKLLKGSREGTPLLNRVMEDYVGQYSAGFQEPDLPSGGGGQPDNMLLDPGPRPDIVPFVLPEADAPTAAVQTWMDTFKSVNDDIQKIADENEKLVREKKAQRDAAALKAASMPKVETEEEKKAKLKAMIPGTDLTVQQGMDFQKSLLEKSFTPEESYQAELAKIKAIHDALGTSEADYQKMIAYTTDQYTAEQKKRADAAEAAHLKEMSGLQRLMMEWANLGKQIDQASVQIMNAIADNITGAIVALADGTKSAKDAFADMAGAIAKDILSIITRLLVQYALMAAMGMAGGVTVPSFTEFSTGALSGKVMHSGGTVGESGPTRSVPAAIFAGAERYHTGGTVLAPGEVPVIAQSGETVLTRGQSDDIRRRLSEGTKEARGGMTVTIINVSDPNEVRNAISRDPDAVLNVLAANPAKMRQYTRQAS